MEHGNQLRIISHLFLFCHLHHVGQPCVWGISFSLQSLITLCSVLTWILITPIRENPFKYYIIPKSCYSHHVCRKGINANSCFPFPFDTCLCTESVPFPVFIVNDKQKCLRAGVWGRYIIFSSINASSLQWHCGIKSSPSDFPRYWYENK